MRKLLSLAVLLLAFAFPASAAAASDDASACGQYHGVFGPPAIDVGDRASSGAWKLGYVGDLNSDPACHA